MSLDTADPALPSLDPGGALLETDGRATGALQSLVLDHLLVHDGPAYWIDGRRDAVTGTLARLAPSDRVLERIHVARGFTAYQHRALLDYLADQHLTPSLIVLPAFDYRYLQDDVRGDADRLFESAIEAVGQLRTRFDVPVLLTCAEACPDALTPLVDQRIRYERTRFGPQFVGEQFETLVYPAGDGTVQTTLAFWAEVLAARHETVEATAPEVRIHGAD